MGVGTFLAGASWFAVDHAIIVDNEKRAIVFDARKESSSLLNTRNIEVRQERSGRPSRRLLWRVYLVKTAEQEVLLWQGRRKLAACRIAQQLSRHIYKPWALHTVHPCSHLHVRTGASVCGSISIVRFRSDVQERC